MYNKMPNYKLSQFGITKEEQDYLSKRLHPAVNAVFLENIAKKNNLTPNDIEGLDYSENEIYQHQLWLERRELNAKRNVEYKGDKNKFKTFAHAKMLDKKSNHILLEDDSKRYGNTEDKKEILKAIGKVPSNTPYDTEDELFVISEDEKAEEEEKL